MSDTRTPDEVKAETGYACIVWHFRDHTRPSRRLETTPEAGRRLIGQLEAARQMTVPVMVPTLDGLIHILWVSEEVEEVVIGYVPPRSREIGDVAGGLSVRVGDTLQDRANRLGGV